MDQPDLLARLRNLERARIERPGEPMVKRLVALEFW